MRLAGGKCPDSRPSEASESLFQDKVLNSEISLAWKIPLLHDRVQTFNQGNRNQKKEKKKKVKINQGYCEKYLVKPSCS